MLCFYLVCILAVLWSVLSCARFFFGLYSRGSSLVCTLMCSVFLWSVFSRFFIGLYSHVLGFSLVSILAVLHWYVLSCARFLFSLYSRGSLVCTLMCSVFLKSLFSRFFIGMYSHVLGFYLVCILAVLWSVLSRARFLFSLYSHGSSLVCTLMCSVFL